MVIVSEDVDFVHEVLFVVGFVLENLLGKDLHCELLLALERLNLIDFREASLANDLLGLEVPVEDDLDAVTLEHVVPQLDFFPLWVEELLVDAHSNEFEDPVSVSLVLHAFNGHEAVLYIDGEQN